MIDNADDYTLPVAEVGRVGLVRASEEEERKGRGIMTLMIITEMLIPESSTKYLHSRCSKACFNQFIQEKILYYKMLIFQSHAQCL